MYRNDEEISQLLHSPSSIECESTLQQPLKKRKVDIHQQMRPPTPLESLSGPSAKKKKTKTADEAEELIIHTLQDLNERRGKVDDEDKHFGRAVAATLHRFSNRQKAYAKLRIQSLLLDIEFPDEDPSQPFNF